MSESTVEATQNVTAGPSLESILWAAAERWSDEPGLVDRDEFADYIFEAWGAETPTEDFVARFFDGDPTVARPKDMAEAVARTSRRRMHVYNFDLKHLEYVVIEDEDQVVIVSDEGQFALPNNDIFSRAIERAIIPGSKDPVGSSGPYDRKSDGTPRAYFVRSSGEIVAVDVGRLSSTVSQMQLELKPVFSPVIGDAEVRLTPFKPTRSLMKDNRELDLLRGDKRVSSFTMPASRKSLVSLVEAETAARGLAAPKTASTAVLLLLPDGTLARPVIGSGSRWRDMVSDWTFRAAALSLDASVQPDAVMDDRRYAVQTNRVTAIFTGVRPTSDSSDAPGSMGLAMQSRGEAIAAVRMLQANIAVLGDDDLAQAILGGAQFVSGLAAPILADARPGTGFWIQPEVYFQSTSNDRDFATREMQLRSQGYSSTAMNNLVSMESALDAPQVAGDPWASWAVQAGSSQALIGRDVDGGSLGTVMDPSALALFARQNRNLGALDDGGSMSAMPGQPIRIPSERVSAFRAPDGTLVFQSAANSQVRLASVHRSVGDDTSSAADSAPAPRQFAASIGNRSGAIPASALAALANALDRTAAASGYKLPRLTTLDSAGDAIEFGDTFASSLPVDSPRRSAAMLADSPLLSGSVGKMILSMPFPSTGDMVVGADLDEALQAWMGAPAIPVGDGSSSLSGWAGSGAFGAAGGAIAGGMALRGADYGSLAVNNPTFVNGSAGAPSFSSSASGEITDFGSSGSSSVYYTSPTGQRLAAMPGLDGSFSASDLASMHASASSSAQRASFILQMPGAAETLSSRAALARLPKLLAQALGSSGGWLPGAGSTLPSAVRDFAMSGPFDLPELANLGSLDAFGSLEGPGLISTRTLNPGEEEIQIPMPLWTQMGRGRLCSTEAVMASPRMRPGFAPPLGVYHLVAPTPVDFTAGAPESTPGILTLQGPTELGLNSSLSGSVAASKLGGQFVLGHIPISDGETVVSRRGRIRIGAPLSPDALSSLGQGSVGSVGASAEQFSSAESASTLASAPQGQLVSGAQASAIRVPGIPDFDATETAELDSASLSPSASGRPFAGALRSALRMSEDVAGRTSYASASSSAFSPGSYGSSSLASPGGESTLVGNPGTIGSYGSAASGEMVAGGSSTGSGALNLAGATDASRASLVSGATATNTASSSGDGISGLPAGAWSGARRDEGGYTPWTYGSRFSPAEQSRGGVDLYSGSRLNRPDYPALPAMLRFRYIGAPLWWTSSTGLAGSNNDSSDPADPEVMGRTLRSGLSAATSASQIWRSIFVNPGSGQQGPGTQGNYGSDAGSMDRTWENNADSMASLSGRMALIAVGIGGSAGAAAASTSRISGPETVYLAMDSQGRGGTTNVLPGQPASASLNELQMKIVAAIPPSPPPLADMASAQSSNVEVRPRHNKAGGQAAHHDDQQGGDGTVSRAQIEGSVDAIAQRIYHRIVRRLDSDRERFGA